MESQWPAASAHFSPLPEHSLATYLFMSLLKKNIKPYATNINR